MEFTGLPKMAKIRQKFDSQPVSDIARVITSEFDRLKIASIITPGARVAVTAGSRGINNISQIMKCLVDELKRTGASPFIVPSMGSHGGATAEGQRKLLSTLNITEETMGVPIRSSMDVVEVGTIEDGLPVVIDRNAYEADYIFVANRVKPHTDFEGINESGLVKMIAIGLGKQQGADSYHNYFLTLGHERVINGAARLLLEKCNIAFGLAIVENELDETAILEIIPAKETENRERELLETAKTYLPRIPFDNIDLLIVDEIGKHFSGTGMDQNVIARTVVPYHVVPERPAISRIFVRDLDENSGGNGLGIGNADFTTSRFVEKFNRRVSYMNSITAAGPEITRIPTYLDTDREAVSTAYRTLPAADSASSRVVWIKNTLHLENMYISRSMLEEAETNDRIEVVGDLKDIGYDVNDNLCYP